MLAGRDVVCISSIDWDFIWQGHQEIMASLAAQGSRVLFIENTGVRPARLRDLPRLRHRLRNWRRGTKGFREEARNLFVYSPLLLPFPYARVAQWVNRALVIRTLRRWMRAARVHRPVLWTFLPTPLARDVIRAVDPALTVYYCIDDLSASSPAARRVRTSEDALLREADLVFVTSEKLATRAMRFSDAVHVFPFGVNFQEFESVRVAAAPAPPDVAALPRPIAGYVGGLHQWVDQALLANVAEQLPHVSFVLVGPEQTDVSQLRRVPNIHLLGARQHRDLPAYVKAFDVGLIPYRATDYTSHVYPTKLNEYLAMGIPVVASELHEISRFNADHHDVVTVSAPEPDSFARAIATALRDRGEDARRRRIDVARQNSWPARIGQMQKLIDEALDARRRQDDGWEESLRRIYRAGRRRLVVPIATAAALYAAIFATPLPWWVAAPLRVEAPVRPVQAIVVFGGGVGESGKAGGGYQERVTQAVDYYKRGIAPHIIFSSGFTYTMREAEVMRELAIGLGVPGDAISIEAAASNTRDNVAFVTRMLRERDWRDIALVSSPYHMRRALLTWRRVAPDITVVPLPLDTSEFYAHRRTASFEQIRAIAHEYVGIATYWWKGWI